MKDLSHLREEYKQRRLLRNELSLKPVIQFELWLDEAIHARVHEPNAMCLSTVDSSGMPQSRMVLLKQVFAEGFVFFTNYESDKGKEIQQHPQVALNFFWPELERQVRIVGIADKVSADLSDTYYYSRPVNSRVGAWVSPQSRVIPEEWLEEEFELLKNSLLHRNLQRPPHWGGYLVQPVQMEFWQGRPSRLHDRFRYRLTDDGVWQIERLAP